MPTAHVNDLSTSVVEGKLYTIGQAVPNVEEYDTGFDPSTVHKSVTAEGKLASTWGQIKTR